MLYAARSVTFNTSPVVLAALIHFVVVWPIVRLIISRFEHRVAV